ncbi:hypothetical protein FB451DRAFT_1564138 [Mycena latifolia]|nr:hypothetical protein FB451DRAFT_1564138 [Mycena latifolia]
MHPSNFPLSRPHPLPAWIGGLLQCIDTESEGQLDSSRLHLSAARALAIRVIPILEPTSNLDPSSAPTWLLSSLSTVCNSALYCPPQIIPHPPEPRAPSLAKYIRASARAPFTILPSSNMCSSLRFWQPLPRLPPPAPLGTQSSAPPYAPILRISDPIFLFPTRVLGSSTLARIHAGYVSSPVVSGVVGIPHSFQCVIHPTSFRSSPLNLYSPV